MHENISKILDLPFEIKTASLGGQYAVFAISHRKAINALQRNGWKQATNPDYITDGINYIRAFRPQYKNHFVVEVKKSLLQALTDKDIVTQADIALRASQGQVVRII